MKKIFIIALVLSCSKLNAQYNFVSNNSNSNFEFVQSVLNQRPIHIHPDSLKVGFTLCWNGKKRPFEIVGPDKKIIKKGKTKKGRFISTQGWKNGTYIIQIENFKETLVLMRKEV